MGIEEINEYLCVNKHENHIINIETNTPLV